MKVIAILILLSLAACGTISDNDTNTTDIKDYSDTSNITVFNDSVEDDVVNSPSRYQPLLNKTLKIGSHYVNSFTEAKVNNEILFDSLKSIYGRYDIVALQGVEDIDVVSRLAGPLDKRYTISQKTGKQFDEVNFAFIYSREYTLIKDYTFKNTGILYEPYVVIFNIGEYNFAIINFLSEDVDAQENIGQIQYITNYIKETEEVNDVYIMGNLYADCDYYTQGVYLKDYTWLINDDTTVDDSICSYSQIIDSNPSNNLYRNSGVDRFNYLDFEYDSLKSSISNEFLVWMELEI